MGDLACGIAIFVTMACMVFSMMLSSSKGSRVHPH